ncbi:hypothetical protein RJ55_06374 [Drechmeria coniospora]|nr:hypothetical protein RJ55_06374 [Drechmeria coniospora]
MTPHPNRRLNHPIYMYAASAWAADMSAPAQEDEPYASRPLDDETDSIRLVTVESDLNVDGLLCCRLRTTTFGSKPVYEALSYRWGDETLRKTIVVDGFAFDVTENLWHALEEMRRKPRKAPIWIDAISINQKNMAEKSRQLRIMPHIYTRASTVLVWLGVEHSAVTVDVDDADGHQSLKSKIVTDAYWNRVWILQEIGKARRIQVWIGTGIGDGDGEALDWDRFLAWLDSYSRWSMNRRGPFHLDHLRRNKYNGSCSLRKLLENHADACCKDPRDKIYGLVGLSSDGRGFPMDYGKSLLDVWVDTIHFMSSNRLLPDDCAELVTFCALVRRLLGGDGLERVGGVVQFRRNQDSDRSLYHGWDRRDNDEMALSAMTLSCDVLGAVHALGPSATELVSSLELTDAWEAELQRIHPRELDTARQEHDHLMQRMLDDADGRLEPLSSFDHHRIDFVGDELFSDLSYYPDDEDEPMAAALRESWNHSTTRPSEPRLAILRHRKPKDKTPFKIALVPARAQLGDLVCRVQGFPMKRLVLRHERWAQNAILTRMHVFGTATTARDLMAERRWDESAVEGGHEMKVMMDARTFYALILGHGADREHGDGDGDGDG